MITKVYYNLNEILQDNSYIINLSSFTNYDVEGLVSILIDENVPAGDNISKELMSHIWANLANKNILCLEVNHPRWVYVNKDNINDFITAEEEAHELGLLGQSIWSIYIDTQQRYRALINIYSDELNNLMNQVETDSETRFNDTPQNLPVNDGYAADNYTTTITSSKVKSDGTSVINRIDEVQQKLRDIYADWAFQFNKLVMED